jgi:D-alanyl-D-alanine carboxypeptidase (penicillin-binding protein 5/6)
MKKSLRAFTLSLFVLSFVITAFAAPASAKTQSHYPGADTEDFPKISAKSAVLMDMNTGIILYDKNMYAKRSPASLTKIMTAIIGLEKIPLNETLIGDEDTAFVDGSKIFFLEGEKAKFKDLIYAFLVASGNDIAIAIAKKVSGSVPEFVKLMNKKAKELGAKNTHFGNPNGLGEEDNWTCAYDMALFSREAMKNKTFRTVVGTRTYHMAKTNKQPERIFNNTNRLLFDNLNTVKVYGENRYIIEPNATGIKTGHNDLSKYCLAASASKGKANYITVTLGGGEIPTYRDTLSLFEYGFSEYKNTPRLSVGDLAGRVDVKGGSKKAVNVGTKQDITLVLPVGGNGKIEEKIVPKKNVEAPIALGEVVGKINFYYEGGKIAEEEVVAIQEVERSFFSVYGKYIIFLVIAIVILIFIFSIRRANRKRRKEIMRRKKFLGV